ncbi:MAG: hypothetical protein NC094_04460 [Bacteroidales bacterium]|nr:hypothetical protein [Lachnoclostridium sp.]MCM1383942.1 hypothetical protein [Lachnoclostridium sp.]MCM1464651.1 hypothetical protein [Bacteroidales bacterium]
MTVIEWLKQALTLCSHFTEMEEADKDQQFAKLKTDYNIFPSGEKIRIHDILKSELENNDCIYVYSILLKYFKEEEFGKAVIGCIMKGNFDWFHGSMLELQVVDCVCHEEKCLLHEKNARVWDSALGGLHFDYTPVEKRNKKRIVIITEHILTTLHSPTLMVLSFAYVLQEILGYEVLLFVCPSDGSISDQLWQGAIVVHSIEQFNSAPIQLEYKDVLFRGYQINISFNDLKQYHMMISLIHEWNPLFVFAMGAYNPVVDLIAKFTTLVAIPMSIKCPVSGGQILVRLGREEEEMEVIYENSAAQRGQIQLFMEDRVPVLTEPRGKKYERQEFGVQEDKFLIAIVGNRLDKEIDEEFSQVMKHILDNNTEAAFAIIGNVNKMKKYFLDEQYKDRVFYLGYCYDLISVYSIMNFYMNPKRKGGGFSSQIALNAGIPIVTLPNCDVAYHAGDDFTVKNYQEMEEVVGNCIKNSSYYEEMKRFAEEIGNNNTNDKMVQYVERMLEQINHYMN